MSNSYHIEEVQTTPCVDQKPGTSGLRKKVKIFLQPNYTENFIQSILNSMGNDLEDSFLVVGGDGRYYGKQAIEKIIKICAANKVRKVSVAENGVMSTPALSCYIRKYGCGGGIILTASHNPGGQAGDFGIKFNIYNGGPAPLHVTDKIYDIAKSLKKYYICPDIKCDISTKAVHDYTIENKHFRVEVVDSVEDYINMMKEIFDFPLLKNYIKNGFKILADSMHGVTSAYITKIFVDELGASPDSIHHGVLLEDFGGLHPDPNLTYAADLVEAMKAGVHDLGIAFDGDGDRNMIIGRNGFFVTPSDSLAVLSANLEYIPYFRKTGVKGYARSMPTAPAVDRVAKHTGKALYEVPTGWKYFGNLMDAEKISICGEESFGTGSDHIREKDGIWAALAWCTVLANTQKSVEETLNEHWLKFGRDFSIRYDYENCDADRCRNMMVSVENMIADPSFVGKTFHSGHKTYEVSSADNYKYTDPIDETVTTNQGLRIIFTDDSRIVLRLSGTGSHGATVRLYADTYENDPEKIKLPTEEVLGPLILIALEISEMKKYTGMNEPTVKT